MEIHPLQSSTYQKDHTNRRRQKTDKEEMKNKWNKNAFQSKVHLPLANKHLQFDHGMTLTLV